MTFYGDPRGAHIQTYTVNRRGWARYYHAYYVPDPSDVSPVWCMGVGVTSDEAVADLWRKLHP